MLICVGYLSTLIRLSFLSSEYVLDIYQVDMCWTFINLICSGCLSVLIEVGYLSTLIRLSFLSTEYVLDIYQVDRSWISINLICVGYLSS